jgi:hypothetical protein
MTFLAPAAFLGLLLLAIPVIVHLFKPRKMRPTPFSSLRWLKQAHQRLSRRIQWHQWLLFLLRAGCLVLLVLALTRPLAGPRASGRPTDRFVVLDVGQAMAYESPGVPAPLERGRELAADLLTHSRPGDRTALLLAGARTQIVTAPVADAASARAALPAVRAESADGNLGASLPLVRFLAPQAEAGRDVELVFLTANRQQSWQPDAIDAFLKHLPQPPRVRVVELGPGTARNAWIAGAHLLAPAGADYRLLRVEVGCVGEAGQERSVHLRGVAGLNDEVQTAVLTAGETTRVDFKVPAGLGLVGQVAELRLQPGDALASDDVYYLNLDTAWALQVLLVEPEAPGEDAPGAGQCLRTGVEVLTAEGSQSLALVSRTAAGVAPGDVHRADIIFLAGVPRLSDAALEALEARVQLGAGLVVFLGPDLDPSFYNHKLYRALQPADGLLPAPLKAGAGPGRQGNPGLLTGVRWSHPLLAPLHDPLQGDLRLCRFSRCAEFTEPLGRSDAVLARFDDDVPALIERQLGAGRVLLWNTTADDRWSDLPRRGSFVPLLDQMIAYLSSGGVRRQLVAGEAVTLPLAEYRAGEEVAVLTPGGARRKPQLQEVGGRAFLRLDDVSEPGMYRVERAGGAGFAFAVNARRDGSPLVPMDAHTLEQWWAPTALEVLGGDEAARQLAADSSGWPLWPALALAGCLLLLAETVYVHRLCPRRDPPAAESVVPRRGLLRPLSK